MPVCCNMFLPMLCIPDRHVGNQCDGIMRNFPAGKFPPVCRNVKYRSMILRAIFQLRKCGKKDIIRMHIEKLHRKPLNCENEP